MEFYELTYIIEEKAQERLAKLAERYKKINGWDEKDILQFAVTAMAKTDIEIKLEFLEKNLESAEKDKKVFFIDRNTDTVKKEWRKNWEKFDWEEVKRKLVKENKEEYSSKCDIGITDEEFAEYLEWLHENLPMQYYKILLSMQLTECGLTDEEVAFWLEHPDILKMVLDKIRG